MTNLRSTGNHLPGAGFIGRQQEMAVLTAALDDALSGRGQMVMLAGEPGIGKTRLAQELASHAESLGAQVLWGWCYEHAGAPPYWPYVQPIRAYVDSADPEQLKTQMGPGGAEIAEIVPELREKLPDLGQPLAVEPEQARFRLFDSVATFLKNVSLSQPLVFVVDDLHWADESSLLMLEFLTREIAASPLLILGTYRDVEVTGRHPLSQTLGNLVRERHFRRIQLGGLTQHEVGEFVEANAGVTLPSDALATIHSRTDGNPLFVNAVVELIDPKQITENRAWADIIPAGVRDAIGRRLSRLSETCNQVLRTASVIGREFSLSQLSPLIDGMTEDGLLGELEEALSASVIEESPGFRDCFQFSHALIQETVVSELPTARRVRLHLRIGEVLEKLYGAGAESHAPELAYHFTQAESVGGKDRLVHYSLLAGQQALAAYGHEEALAFFQKALAAKEWPPIDGEVADLLFGTGRALAVTLPRYQVHEAVDQLSLAFNYYVETGDIARAIEVAECPVPNMAGNRTGMMELLSSALELVEPDSHEEGKLLSLFGMIKGQQGGDYQASNEAFDRALAIAKREQDASLELRTLASASYVDWFHLRPQACIDRSNRVLELGQQNNDPSVQALAHYGSVYSLCEIGNISEARQHAAACVEAGEKFQDRFWLPGALLRNVTVFMLEGNWAGAREFSDRALAMADTDPRNLGTRVILEYGVGNSSRGHGFLQRLLEARRLISSVEDAGAGNGYSAVAISVAARTVNGLDGVTDARQAAQTILSSDIATPVFCQTANAGLGILAVIDGDATEARQSYDALVSSKGTLITLACMSSDRLLGLLAQTMGNAEAALDHFEEALSFCRSAGFLPELAWTCHDYAEAILSGGGPEGRQKAISLVAESLSIAADLGMRPLVERAGALQERAEAQPARSPAYPDGLTQREVEVLRLISGGKTDREIGEELFISVKTVGNHVSNILNKTSTANRTEAATYAAMNGLTVILNPDAP